MNSIKHQTFPMLIAVALLVGCGTETTGASGTVVNEAGEPIAGATLRLHDWHYDSGGKYDSLRKTGTTDTNGEFSIQYEGGCDPSNCIGGGALVVIADGYESSFYEISERAGEQFDSDISIKLPEYDGLTVDAIGIPDEQPRPLIQRTEVKSYVAYYPRADSFSESQVQHTNGTCDQQITVHGRLEEYRCTGFDGKVFDSCFVLDDERLDNAVVCTGPLASQNRIITRFALNAELPVADLSNTSAETLPRWVTFSAGLDEDQITCIYLPNQLVTNVGEEVIFQCNGAKTTWLLSDIEQGVVWSATRIGSDGSPNSGILNKLGSRKILFQSVSF